MKKHLKKSRLIILLMAIAGLSAYWLIQSMILLVYPMRPLFVSFNNLSGSTVVSINIDHGNFNTQEKIQLMQLLPGEKRYVALNHEPGQGFNVEINYADGKKFDACIGRFSESWHLNVDITPSAVDVIEVW